MPMCEKCWGDAYMMTLGEPSRSQGECYQELLVKRAADVAFICTPKEQAGQWWDEDKQRDSRNEGE